MNAKTTSQYTTVSISKDLHFRLKKYAVDARSDIRTEAELAIAEYLKARAARKGTIGKPEPVGSLSA